MHGKYLMCLILGSTSKLSAVFGESGSQQTSHHKSLKEVTPNVRDPEVCESSKLVSYFNGRLDLIMRTPLGRFRFTRALVLQALSPEQHIKGFVILISTSCSLWLCVARSDSVYPKLTNMNRTVWGFMISLLWCKDHGIKHSVAASNQ